MKTVLGLIFGAILVAMIAVTSWASSHQAMWKAGHLLDEPWFLATLLDAYFGFITFYVWVAYKERAWLPRIGWFVAIMGLGNMAMAAYVLIKLARLRTGFSWEELLLRQAD